MQVGGEAADEPEEQERPPRRNAVSGMPLSARLKRAAADSSDVPTLVDSQPSHLSAQGLRFALAS